MKRGTQKTESATAVTDTPLTDADANVTDTPTPLTDATDTSATDATDATDTSATDAVDAPLTDADASAEATADTEDLTPHVFADTSDTSSNSSLPCTEKNGADEEKEGAPDAEAWAKADVAEIARLFPEAGVKTLTDIDNPVRFAVLREAGLSTEEAYLATNYHRLLSLRARLGQGDSKSHLTTAKVGGVKAGGHMPTSELIEARALFEGMSDTEIERLYNRTRA